ncbi:MAG: HAMP domain-containing histidine kinase, partial [Candidatus Omnitrophica bacterium]|nr:HAMP domain-containing histidine kinase [Candidatus Omnitrophota bacterium]
DAEYKEAYLALEKEFVRFKAATALLVQNERLNALKEVISGAAHDLNQPLNVSKIICQGILRDIQKDRFSLDDAKKDLPEILTQMNRMADMVSNLRFSYRRADGKPKEEADLNALVRGVLKPLAEQYKNHRITVTEHFADGVPHVLVDAPRIEQVCYHLIKNARYAVEKSGKKPMTIDVRTLSGADGQEAVLEIADNGTGIPDDIKARVFEPFFTTKTPDEGIGFGLSVCDQYIAAHGGRLEFESKVGEGSTFRMILPAFVKNT